jgi:MoaA/NifB/PqqE/SkfB family radical SAM enzyme
MKTNELYMKLYGSWNYRLRTVAGGRLALYCRPASIVILLTELCNAHCVHCDIWKNRGKEDSPTPEQWKKVLSDLRSWLGPVHVTFSGGEALLRPFTTDLVAYASSIGLCLEILTHGYWEDQSKIENLALAKPWKVTISLDGIGETHSKIRGRDKFWDRTSRSIETLKRMRSERGLNYTIRLKNVIMAQNLDQVIEVARFGNHEGMEVFFQPIEQNYNTPEDQQWYLQSENWPKDTARAIANVRELIRLKKQGYRVANSFAQLEAMIPYFEDPDAHRVAVMTHNAHETRRSCAALTNLQFQANGDVTVCTGAPRIGNVKETPIRRMWENRPKTWESGCCLEWRCSPSELQILSPANSLTALSGRDDLKMSNKS